MAISYPHYKLLKSLKPILPQGGTLLEIGEANWYGDVPAQVLLDDTSDSAMQERIRNVRNLFDLAKLFYEMLFRPSRVESVDLHGTDAAHRLDLNKPLPICRQFDVVINHGTAEHIFNIAQVFASMHERCKPGGLMVHEAPFTGWVDHGFYTLQPTLFYDVAAANGYEIVKVAIAEIATRQIIEVVSRDDVHGLSERGLPNNAILFVVFRRNGPGEFQIPTQGYYARSLSAQGMRAWGNR